METIQIYVIGASFRSPWQDVGTYDHELGSRDSLEDAAEALAGWLSSYEPDEEPDEGGRDPVARTYVSRVDFGPRAPLGGCARVYVTGIVDREQILKYLRKGFLGEG